MTLSKKTFGWMRDGIGNLRAAREIESFLSLGQVGRVWWFDPIDGGTDNSGERADDATATLQAAIDLTAADRGDLIIRMRGYDEPTATINFNKQGISVVAENFGMSPQGLPQHFTHKNSNTDGPSAKITKGCYIRGIQFVGSQNSGDDYNACVIIDGEAAAGNGYTWLDRCTLDNYSQADVNYGLVNRGAPLVRVSDCDFRGGGASNSLEAGLLIDNSGGGGSGRPSSGAYIANRFRSCIYAFEMVTGAIARETLIQENIMGWDQPNSAWVKLFKQPSTAASAIGGRIVSNHLATGVGTGSFSHTLAQLQTSGWRLSGNNYSGDLGHLS